MNKPLTRDQILQAQDIRIEKVEVPEWGGEVYVKTLTGQERDQLEAALMEYDNKGQPKRLKLDRLRSTLAVLAICDESGQRLFTSGDIQTLAGKSSAALDRVVSKAQELAAISPGDVDKLVTDLKKDQADDSPLD